MGLKYGDILPNHMEIGDAEDLSYEERTYQCPRCDEFFDEDGNEAEETNIFETKECYKCKILWDKRRTKTNNQP